MNLINMLTNTFTCLTEEELVKVTKRTFVKNIYSCWESNDEGEDLDLYTGLIGDDITPRYFLKHFSREWWGGWTYDDTQKWYEISEQDYMKLCKFEKI